MSQNPLDRLRNRTRPEPISKPTFPDQRYRASFLDTREHVADQRHVAAAYRAFVIVLAEHRALDDAQIKRATNGMLAVDDIDEFLPNHPLERFEATLTERSGPDALLGIARDDVLITAQRMTFREEVLATIESIDNLADAIVQLARGHLTTMLLLTGNEQVLQPSTLAHYLSQFVPGLERARERLQSEFANVNLSPFGSGVGVSTAVPMSRRRLAELLGFDGPTLHTLDGNRAVDIEFGVLSTVASVSAQMAQLVGALRQWSRDDLGLATPSAAYLHTDSATPHRRDPRVLEHLHLELTELTHMPVRLLAMTAGAPMLLGTATRMAIQALMRESLGRFAEVIGVLGEVLASLDVNRSLFSYRANRGFATSSELADLLAVDFELPLDEARALVHQVVLESIDAGKESASLTTDVIDAIALRMRGVELGMEPELLAKTLSPKQFIDRRAQIGGPAPSAVGALLDGYASAAEARQIWTAERWTKIQTAAEALIVRLNEIAADPAAAYRRR